MNKVAAFALRRKNSILSMLEKMFCPPQPLRFWITPAYAGKRGSGSPPRSCRRDHPRVCEEKVTGIRSQTINEGSPPRVRGKASSLKRSKGVVGITPAYAGKSTDRLPACSSSEDHPRVCGEKYPSEQHGVRTMGSPLRVRGKAGLSHGCLVLVGITPARAGKSCPPQAPTFTRQDHPRLCGEKFHPASDRKLGRVRGTKRSSGPAPAAAPAGLAGSCPASPPWSYPPRITVSRPRP